MEAACSGLFEILACENIPFSSLFAAGVSKFQIPKIVGIVIRLKTRQGKLVF